MKQHGLVVFLFLISGFLFMSISSSALNIDDIEVMTPIYHDTFPSDASWWNLEMVNASGGWEYTKGSSDVVVAIIDSGVMFGTSELPVSSRWENSIEINGIPGVDDDMNGYVDDFYGYDFAEDVYDNDPGNDSSGLPLASHGTEVASVIIAQHNDAKIAGIAPNVKIMNLRVLDIDNMVWGESRIIEAFLYAMRNGADVINYSIQSSGNSAPFYEMLQTVVDTGVAIVGITGNAPDLYHPGDSPAVIAVGAVNSQGDVTQFSQKGDFVEIVAPGDNVPVLGSLDAIHFLWGTSFAAPHVTGTIALMRSVYPSMSVNDIRSVLHWSATDINEPGKDNTSGYGLLNIGKAVYGAKYFNVTDFDDDGLVTSYERELNLDPFNPDTDGDGMPDGWEVKYHLNPLDPFDALKDNDGDGLINLQEYQENRNPLVSDNTRMGFLPFPFKMSILVGVPLLLIHRKRGLSLR